MTAAPEDLTAQLRDALEACREAIGIPIAATVGGGQVRGQILDIRVMHLSVFLDSVLGEPAPPDIPRRAAYLRERLAEHPATGYETWDERIARRRKDQEGGVR